MASLERKYKWQSLFDGTLQSIKKHFQWRWKDKSRWSVKDGLLTVVIDKKIRGGFLTSKKDYKNFVFDIEVKFNRKKVNSGIIYFSKKKVFEFQIGDNYLQTKLKYPDKNYEWISLPSIHRTGSVYDLVANPYDKLIKQNGWNKIRVVSYNGRIEHHLNGKHLLSVNINDEKFKQVFIDSKYYKGKVNFPTKGKIAIQDHSDTAMSFRNIRILNLDK